MSGKIILNGISKRFEEKCIIDDISYIFEQGKIYIISGESGCGKTTLLNILAGYISPNNGNVTTNSKISYMFQDELLFSNLTVIENLYIRLYAYKNSDIDYDEVINEALVSLGIESLIDKKVNLLSGGERQRVQLASILLSEPDVILLDEPTVKLDEENKVKMIEVVEHIFKDKTLIIVTHDEKKFSGKYTKLKITKGKLYEDEL